MLPALVSDLTVFKTVMERVAQSELVPFHALELTGTDGLIDRAIDDAKAALDPAGRHKAYEGLIFAIKVLSSRTPENDVLSGYAAILGDLPADLLAKAFRAGLGGATYHKLPPPGAFMKPVAEEWIYRKAVLSRLIRHKGRTDLARKMRPSRSTAVEATAPQSAAVRATSAE